MGETALAGGVGVGGIDLIIAVALGDEGNTHAIGRPGGYSAPGSAKGEPSEG